MMWPSATIPDNWQLCDGSSLNRQEYAALFSVLGTIYGNNDSSTFRIPDMRGMFVAGCGANNYTDLNQKGGANTVALSVNEMPKHNHDTSSSTTDGNITISGGEHQHTINVTPNQNNGSGTLSRQEKNKYTNTFTTPSAGSHTHTIPLKARGAGAAHENRPPFIVLNYIIKIK